MPWLTFGIPFKVRRNERRYCLNRYAEIGRNLNANSIIDQNGRAALDHTNGDPMARDVFCMVGPDGVVNQDS